MATTTADGLIRHADDSDRWIVKERDDGKNVNNWHWSERDLTGWAKVPVPMHNKRSLRR